MELIARSMSLLPINLYNRSPGGRQRADWHPLQSIVRNRPNAEEPSSVFIEKVVRDMLQYGNAFIWKSYSGGTIDALYTLEAKAVQVYRDRATHQKRFSYGDRTYTSRQILHIPGAFYDGLIGHSPAKYAANAIKMGVQLDEFASEAFNSGVSSRLAIDISEKFPNGATPDQVRGVATYIARNYAGPENAGKPLILYDKMKADEISGTSNREQELLSAREYQERVISKVFNVPLSMLGDSEGAYGEFESRQIAFLLYTLGPWIRRIEQYLSMLLTPSESVSYYVEVDTNSLLKTNIEARTSAYRTMIQTGILSIDEVRKRENLDALDDPIAGQTHFGMASLMPLNKETIEAYMASAKLKQQQLPVDKKVL
jgi:HK97 family phage portal protein